MAITKSTFGASRLDGDVLAPIGDGVFSQDEDDDLQSQRPDSESDNNTEPSEPDSGMGSDDYDMSELAEIGTENCQVGNQSFHIPLELYDLPDLSSILSLETWNDCLAEDERLSLAAYLPDMDQETYSQTMRELLSGSNFHFGSPLADLFSRLKGGLCEPRVDLHRRCLNFFQRSEHYHRLQKYQNSMVDSLVRMRNAWENYTGYGIEERIRLLNILRSQRSISQSNNLGRDSATDSENDDYPVVPWNKKSRNHILPLKSSGATKNRSFPRRLATKKRPSASGVALPRKEKAGFDPRKERNQKNYIDDDRAEAQFLETPVRKRTKPSQKLEKEAISLGRKLKKGARPPVHEESLQSLHRYEPPSWDSPDTGGQEYLQRSLRHGDRHDGHQSPADALSVDHPRKTKNKTRSGEGAASKVKSRRPLLTHVDANARRLPEAPASDSSGHGHEDVFTSPLKRKKSKRPAGLPSNGRSKEAEEVASGGRKIQKNAKDRRKPSPSPLLESAERKSVVDLQPSRRLTKRRKLHGGRGAELGEAIPPDILSVEAEEKVILSPRGDVFQRNWEPGHEDGLLDGALRSTDAGDESVGSGLDFSGKSKSNVTLAGCNSATKKRRGKAAAAAAADDDQLGDDEPGRKKKKGKRRSVSGTVSLSSPNDTGAAAVAEKEELLSQAELEPSPSKKPFTLITPSVHTGFSFSVVHLLCAVRKAMVSAAAVDEVMEEDQEEKNPPLLTVQEIVARVRTNPGDPCILETQEPLQELVRGVLKILASKTAPLGAKGWKPLVLYEKSAKTWSWIGGGSTSEEETSADAWGIPHKTLVKLVDSFANWLKNGQETLKQIGSLPAPPALPPPILDEKERFKDLRAQKSLVTINPSSEEARAYFRREELLRYSVPDRAFSYTAADGRKSTVAPLRRGGGKPTSKARDHFMLKQDRPPHVTILCLVRDAAARLPASIGTRADVSTLMRDSQYLVEDVPDAKINSVVSGALDRLHYEQDPCVQYDGERKLWVYLHRDREEEDFEDDGTASKKKWKRPRREHGVGGGAAPAGEDCEGAVGFDNAEEEEEEEGVAALIDSMEKGGAAGQGHPMGWEVLGVGPAAAEERMVCRENSTNEDYDDDGFSRERTAGLVTSSLF